MHGPIVAIDVSKGCSHLLCFKDFNQKYGKVFKFNHDVEGFKFLLERINILKEVTNEEVKVVYEATGVYTKALTRFLDKNNIEQYIISPLKSAKQRKTEIHAKKTDTLDPISIAEVYYLSKNKLRAYEKEEDIYHRLRCLNRNYVDQKAHLVKYKVTFQNYLEVVFPLYDGLFSDVYNDISLCLLLKYPHPDAIKYKKPETIAKYLSKHTNHYYEYCLKKAKQAIALANKIYPGCDKDDIEVIELIRITKMMIECIKECDSLLEELINLAKSIPNYEVLKSIPGIGENLAARILSEIGDINNYESYKDLISYTGTDPYIDASGQKDGKHLSITKKGNKYLRTLLYLAVTCALRLKDDNSIKDFYKKKKQQSTPLKSKAAKVACMNKLLRIIYAMSTNGTMYQYVVVH